jgi:hypothetical protein
MANEKNKEGEEATSDRAQHSVNPSNGD